MKSYQIANVLMPINKWPHLCHVREVSSSFISNKIRLICEKCSSQKGQNVGFFGKNIHMYTGST